MHIEELLNESMRKKPISNRASRKRTSTPEGVIRLNFNENAFGMSPKVSKTLLDATSRSFMYPDFYAINLKQTIADYYNLTRDNIITGSGSSAIIDMIGEVFLNPGDEVIFCDPTFEAFRDMANDNGAICVAPSLDKNYCFDLDAMYEAITDKTKIVVVCNPNNPTGTYVPAKQVEAFIRKIPSNILVVVDEAYIQYVCDPENYSMTKLVQEGIDQPVIVLHTFSKIYGMAGVRVGYGVADTHVIDQLMKTCQAWNMSYAGEIAASVAFGEKEYVNEIREKTKEGREYIERELSQMGCDVIPSAANFIYFDAHMTPEELKLKLHNKKIEISAFDLSRVSVGTMDENKAFIEAMKEIL
ncbi:MAG: histidinol-phosphate transaminase [Velocimicrobium sp.]